MRVILFILVFVVIVIAQDKQLYTCGMHPNVIQEGPGTCPICEMDLTPIKKEKALEKGERKILYWRAPMNPEEVYDKPGKSNMGMDLVPVYSDEVEGASVKISPALQQNMGVRTATVYTKPLIKKTRTTGSIQFDETRVSHSSLKINGWIEKLDANFVGQKVKKGQSLLEIYSPEVVNAQQEYLTAYKSSKVLGVVGVELLKSAKTRLEFWDISENTINELIKRGKPFRTVKIKSPFSGAVTMKMVEEGHYVKRGSTIMEIADLSKVWLIMDIYEKDLPFIKTGQEVFVTLPYDPKAQFTGTIDYLFPVLDKKTRSVKARVVLHNPEERLKVNMLANAKISSVLGGNVLVVPSEAVIRTGERELVIMDNGDNTFTPREVKLGYYFDDVYEITGGLSEGDKIVTSAQFLIDSESKLKEAIQKLINAKTSNKSDTMKMNATETFSEILLPSIQCDQCVNTITKALKNTDGVSSVHIDLENKKAHIGYDKSLLSQSSIEGVIAKSGYHANKTKRLQWAYTELPSCCKEE